MTQKKETFLKKKEKMTQVTNREEENQLPFI
jgi:hypothetical protein